MASSACFLNCPICKTDVKDKGLICNRCQRSVHENCLGINGNNTIKSQSIMACAYIFFYCPSCKPIVENLIQSDAINDELNSTPVKPAYSSVVSNSISSSVAIDVEKSVPELPGTQTPKSRLSTVPTSTPTHSLSLPKPPFSRPPPRHAFGSRFNVLQDEVNNLSLSDVSNAVHSNSVEQQSVAPRFNLSRQNPHLVKNSPVAIKKTKICVPNNKINSEKNLNSPPLKSIILGDSMIRDQGVILFEKGVVNCEVNSDGGAKIEQVTRSVKNKVAKNNDANIVVSVGTNNIYENTEVVKAKYIDLINELKNRRANSAILGILPRPKAGQEWNSRAIYLNNWLSKICTENNIYFVDMWDAFSELKLFSFQGIHLNRSGKNIFNDVLLNFLNTLPNDFLSFL